MAQLQFFFAYFFFAFALFRQRRLISIEGDRRLEGSSAQHANVYLIHVWDMRRTYIGYAYVVYVWSAQHANVYLRSGRIHLRDIVEDHIGLPT